MFPSYYGNFDCGFVLLFRPYHTLLFLVDEVYLVRSLPGDCSPAVTRLVRMASPLKRYKLSSVVRGKELTPSFLPGLLMMFVTIILMENPTHRLRLKNSAKCTRNYCCVILLPVYAIC